MGQVVVVWGRIAGVHAGWSLVHSEVVARVGWGHAGRIGRMVGHVGRHRVTHVSLLHLARVGRTVWLHGPKHKKRDIDQLPGACSGGSSEGVAVCDEGETLDEVEDQNETSLGEEVSSPALGAASGPSLWVSWPCPARMIHHCTKIDSGVSTNLPVNSLPLGTLKPSPPLCKLPS